MLSDVGPRPVEREGTETKTGAAARQLLAGLKTCVRCLSYGRPSLWVIVSGNLTEALPAQLLEINVPHRALFPIDPLSCVHLMCPLRKLRQRVFFAPSRVFRSLCCRFIECLRTVGFVSCFLLSKLHDSSFFLTSFYNTY